MLKLKKQVKKWLAIGAAGVTASALVVIPVKADGMADSYLQQIAQYTYQTAQAAYYIEQYIYSVLTIMNSWILPDKSDTTASLQSSFTNITNTVLKDSTTQNNLQMQLSRDLLVGANTNNAPYANDLTYATLLGQLYFNPDPRKKNGQNVDSAYNYIKNAAGMNITHLVPNPTWRGSNSDKQNYTNFYSTIMAIESYNAYLLSQLYADYTNGNQLSQQQNALIQQASNSDWFSQVASENIGIVLRQMLMYSSQMYVVMTQLLQTQKQMLSAQAMTNTLIILGNQFNETQLLGKATGAISSTQ